MAATLGVNDLKQLALPVGWDAGEMQKYRLEDGTTYEALVNSIAGALALAGGMLEADSRYGGLISTTTEDVVEYRQGANNGMQKRSEYSKADARRAGTIGHMLGVEGYDRVLGWTYEFLRKARGAQLDADIADAISDVKENWEKQILTRFFSTTENAIGTTGYDVPFIHSNSGNVDTIPPTFDGQTFAATHDHFDRKGTTNQADALKDGARHLKEHGIKAPYTAVVPEADTATYTALVGLVRPDRGYQYVRTDGSNGVWAVAPISEDFIGIYETDDGPVYLWYTAHLPTAYLGLYKSYGLGDQRNPLMVRYSADYGVGPVLLRGAAFQKFPIEEAVIHHDFGVGVSAGRLNGYACYFNAAGSYTDPTIA